MSRAVVCENCGSVLIVNQNGEDDEGEISGWLAIEAGGRSFDACTRSCAVALIEGPIVEVLDAYQEMITGIAQIIRGDADDTDD